MKDGPAWKIVLIDDEEDIRDVVSIVLEDQGFSVAAAENGEKGLALCRTLSPQIVITDIRMPGMDGIQVLQTLKEEIEDIEVIVVTAFGEIEIAVRALQLDASDFITKPIDEGALFVALDRAQKRYTSQKALKDYTGFLEREKAKTAEELIRIYSFQKNLIENSMDGILACNETGQVVTFNRQMEKMLGYKKEEIKGRRFFPELFEENGDQALKKAMAGPEFGGENRLFLYETLLKTKAGRTIPVQVSAAVLEEREEERGWVCFFRDLRQIRKLERELSDQAGILHQDKMMSLGRLSASVVHEINNPLFGVLNYVRLMIRILNRGPLESGDAEKFMRYLALVEKETERCSTIISSLLKFSRKSEPRFGEVDLNGLLDKCILLSRHKLELSGIEQVSRIDEGLPVIQGDSNQLQQCLINLIFNAVDAMPRGGTLTLSCSHDPREKRVNLGVRDTGAGIKKEDLPHIFEPFFTTKKEGYGVGLGLSTVSGIIEHHRGSVSVESRPGHTLFTIGLPV
ncbi:hybrid sensor histidine kinase/response regulator [Desulfospira joergensenii]|uniref:hybrid sensor histidine kinase/response regulator n=1 Tax=Desulfospira joergensenii TaxID=53329 RepID=UPI00041FAAF9|nr:response regulator [Desulfospira joergensenii]